MRGRRARFGDDRGFTLIELMVVVLIIGILAAIAVPSFLGAQDSAKDSAAKATLKNAYTTAKVYQAESGGTYVGFDAAGVAADLEASLPWPGTGDGPSIEFGPISQYAIEMKLVSASGNLCTLSADDEKGTLELGCTGPDAAPAP